MCRKGWAERSRERDEPGRMACHESNKTEEDRYVQVESIWQQQSTQLYQTTYQPTSCFLCLVVWFGCLAGGRSEANDALDPLFVWLVLYYTVLYAISSPATPTIILFIYLLSQLIELFLYKKRD